MDCANMLCWVECACFNAEVVELVDTLALGASA